MTDLTPILTRFTDASWDDDTLLDELIPCSWDRAFGLRSALEEEHRDFTDAQFSQLQTVGDILRSLETINA